MAENRTTDWPLSPEALLERVREIALDAGRGVEAVKERARGTAEQKEDGSPVTVADRRAHEIIVAGLRPLTPDLPVVSEEARPGHESNDARFWWLVDPLDGTKAFIAGSDDYTVNIALVDSDQPVLGVIYAPASDALYEAVPGHAARRPGTGQEEASTPGSSSRPSPPPSAARTPRTRPRNCSVSLAWNAWSGVEARLRCVP
jgi:3'(2'), 5'-bisphosphate nucleotidase